MKTTHHLPFAAPSASLPALCLLLLSPLLPPTAPAQSTPTPPLVITATSIELTNALFDSNTSSTAGAAVLLNGGTAIFNSSTFLDNTTTANNTGIGGGALYATGPAFSATLNDTSFIGNHSADDAARGGAIAILNPAGDSTLTLATRTGTSYIAGNTQGTANTPSGLAVLHTGNYTMNINIATAANTALDMLDPFYVQIAANAANILNITKTGPGTWALAATSTLNKQGNNGSLNLNINQGTLYLYRAGETINVPALGPVSTKTGNLAYIGSTANTPINFTLAPGANLKIGGGNTISFNAPTQTAGSHLTLSPGSILTYDLAGAYAAGLGGSATSPLLTLTTNGLNSLFAIATSGTFDFHLNFDTWIGGSYNLLSVTKGAYSYLNYAGTPPSANNAFLGLANDTGLWQQSLLDNITYAPGLAAPATAPTIYLDTAGNLWITFPGAPPALPGNHVLTWTGATDTSWSGPANWTTAGADTPFNKGDIINLANTTALVTTTLNIDTTATIAAMYLSGTANYTITGNPLAATSASIGLTFDPATIKAATGKLILGATAATDGLAYATSDTTPAAAYQGTLTLANTSNNFQNGIEIHTGQLIANTANLATTPAGILLYTNGTLTINQTTPATYTTPITSATPGAGQLHKTGTATLTLAGGAADYSTYTGHTTIDAGTLLLAPAAKLGGPITVNPAATLAGADGAAALDTVTLANNSTLQIGAGPAPAQTLTLAALTLGAAPADTALLDFTNLTNQLIITNLITQNGLATLNISATTPGTHQLINVLGPAGLTTTNFNTTKLTVTYNGAPLDTTSYTLGLANNWLTIFFDGVISKTLTWTGATNRSWDTTTTNWLTVETTGTPAPFSKGDIVNLTTTSSGTINIPAPLTAGALYLSGNAPYTLAGAGLTTGTAVTSITGDANTGKLVLGQTANADATLSTTPFTATLDLTGITGTNNFTAGVDIYSGALRVSTTDQLGVKLNALHFTGTTGITTGTLVLAAGSNITFNGAGSGTANRLNVGGTTSGVILLEDSSTMTFTRNNAGAITGAAVNLNPGASLVLGAADDSRYMFQSNVSLANGAAIGVTGTDASLAAGNFLILSNTAPAGGGLYMNGGAAVFNSGTFQKNTATANNSNIGGGAFYAATSGFSATFNDVSFIGNSSINNGARGGAIGINSPAGDSTLALNALTGTSFLAGNTTGPAGAATSSGIAINTSANFALNLNILTNPGAVLDMPDPFYLQTSANNTACILTINKDGEGLWKLAGTNTLYKSNGNSGSVNMNVNAGTLYLYREGEKVSVPGLGTITAKSGNIIMQGVNANSPVNFLLAPGARLGIGGGNSITISSPTQSAGQHITLSPNSILSYDLIGASAAGLGIDTSSPLLKIASTGLNSQLNIATTGTFDFNLNFSTWTSGSFNLLIAYKGTAAGTPIGAGRISYITSLGFTDGAGDWQQALLNGMTFDGRAPNPAKITTSVSIDPAGNLWVIFLNLVHANNVLTWTGAADASWLGETNWTALGSGTEFNKGDIINLADNPALSTRTLTVDTIGSATIGALYLSGTTDYTITGNPIAATTDAVGDIFDPAINKAATGKLILGGSAAPDGITYATTTDAAYQGTLTLENKSNNFQNGIEIYSGQLTGNAANLGAGPAGIKIHDTGTLTFNQTPDTGDAAYDAPIAGTGQLGKTGSATLTLAADYTTFTGQTIIDSGLLLLAGGAPAAKLGGAITVNATGALGGGAGATATGNVTLNDSAALQVGAGDAPAQLFTIGGALAIGDDVLLDYISFTNRLHVAGPVTLTGTAPATININTFQSGTYDLGNLAPLYDHAAVTIKGEPQFPDARQRAFLTQNGPELILNGVGDASRIMTWSGSTNNTWAPTASDWVNSATGVFANGDRVLFGDTIPAAPATITVFGKGVTASDMYVNGTTNYTFTGGAIATDANSTFTGTVIAAAAWTGKLYKDGPSTLTLANDGNNFTAGIQLNAGALNIAGLTTAGGTTSVSSTATLQFSGTAAALAAARVELAPGATLAGNGALLFDTLALAGSATAAIAPGNTLALTGAIAPAPGALIIKTGAGELQFAAPSTGNATTRLDQGALSFVGTTTITAPLVAQTVILNNGLLSFGNDIAASVNLDTARDWSGVTVLGAFDPAVTATITGINDIVHLNGSGTVVTNLAGGIHVALDPGDDRTVSLGNTASTLTGAVRIDSGTLQLADLRVVGGAGSANNTKLSLNGGILEITNTMTLAGDLQLRAPENTLVIDDTLKVTLTRVTRPASYAGSSTLAPPPTTFIKAGTGTLALTGANQATSMIIDAGRYIVQGNNNTVDTSSTITINAGAVFEFATTNTAWATSTNFFAGQPFSATASGQTRANFSGSGTLEVTKGVLFMYAPVCEVANINVTGPGVALAIINNFDTTAFGLNSVTTVDQASLVIASKITQIGAIVLKNNAQLGFQMDTTLYASSTLKLDTYYPEHFENNVLVSATTLPAGSVVPAYFRTDAQIFKTATIKSLASEGPGPATLHFNINLARGLGDHMTLLTPATGDYAIAVYNFGAVPASYTSAIELITAPPSPGATFTTLTPEIEIGLFKYNVTAETAAGGVAVRINGTGAMSNSAAFINEQIAAMPLCWFSELDTINQRLGELHLGQGGARGVSGWVRGYGERINYNRNLTGASFSETHYAGAAGLDGTLTAPALALHLGAFMGYGNSQRNRPAPGSEAQTDSVYYGAYATAIAKTGWYLDATAKFNNFKSHFTAIAPTGEAAAARYHNWAIGGSLELGKHIALEEYGWFFKPQIQAAWTALSDTSYLTDTGMAIHLARGTATRARMGIMIGRALETRTLGTLTPYLKAFYGRQWSTGCALAITTTLGDTTPFSPVLKGENVEFGAGLAWQLTKATQFYLDYDTTQASAYKKPWAFNLGLRHNW